jgi:hypothetical protein
MGKAACGCKRKTQAIVCIVLEPYGDDSRVHERNGNQQRLSHNAETAENPRRVWTFKLLERMPAGIQQTIGDTGWQLSQGERSRVFLARALLQNSPADADAGHRVRSRDRRSRISCRGIGVAALDCRAPQQTERPEGLSVLPASRL